MIDFSLSSIPKAAGIYAMYDQNGDVAYVGHSGHLRHRVGQHIIRRNSSVTTGVSATVLDPEKVGHICWWLTRFSDKDHLEAAEIVAFKVLDPSLRSRGKITKRAKAILENQAFCDEMECLFRDEPSGAFYPKTFDNLVDLVLELDKRVSELEKQKETQ